MFAVTLSCIVTMIIIDRQKAAMRRLLKTRSRTTKENPRARR
jgi:hypothetical protein